MRLDSSIVNIKGVGPRTLEQFHAAGLETVDDLINFLPRKHEDFTHVVSIADIKPGKSTIKAKAESITTSMVRRGLRITKAVLADQSGKLNAVWFNQPYREKQLKEGGEFFFSGEFEYNYGRYQLTNPSAEIASEMPVQADRLLPVYRSIKGLKSQAVRKVLEELRPLMSVLPETLPRNVVDTEKLVSRADAISQIHFPRSIDEVQQARERLAFEELFSLMLANQLNKIENQKLEGFSITFEQTTVKSFVAALPFALTAAQRRAAWDILQDFERQVPMNRLLQGDVGSGKTVVAGLAMRQAASHGFQSALMAPTEILAKQHADTLDRLLSPFGVKVALLIGSVKGTARKALYTALADGDIDVIVGTHALIQDTVHFKKLGFVVIDEQHRFGVNQRQKLLDKSHHMPHLLAMTATPIPRSLALTVYGELDITVIAEKPVGRKAIITKIVSPISVKDAYARTEEELAKGRQAYVVCSLINDNPENDKKSVTAEHRRLKSTVFARRSIGLLHGKMTPDEKDQIMQDFKDKKYDILVSTTVVEVGVDVPNATVMIIENADQFGLSQLHQLRGRVGRSDQQSYCYLVMSTTNKPSERIREIEKSNDGFYLAEVDLKLRGPGEIYGRAQHGALNLQIASLADTAMIARAQKAAKAFIESGGDMTGYGELERQVRYYQRLTTLN